MRSAKLDIQSNLNGDDKDPLVSIVVPVFNAPVKALERCLLSLFNQSYSNVEFIIVDDGSDDECLAVEQRLVSAEARARIVKGGHKGVSHARNIGIREAQGEWVAFSDSDDELNPLFINQALQIALGENVDLVCGGVASLYLDDSPTDGCDVLDYCVLDETRELMAAQLQMLGNVYLTSNLCLILRAVDLLQSFIVLIFLRACVLMRVFPSVKIRSLITGLLRNANRWQLLLMSGIGITNTRGLLFIRLSLTHGSAPLRESCQHVL